MEGEGTSLRAELQVFLDSPANFYNVVMERSGEHAQRGAWSEGFRVGRGWYTCT